jgi:hypothetical protein
MSGVQLRIAESPLDPRELAALPIFERAVLDTELGLHPIQREAAEAAVRMIMAGPYGGVS